MKFANVLSGWKEVAMLAQRKKVQLHSLKCLCVCTVHCAGKSIEFSMKIQQAAKRTIKFCNKKGHSKSMTNVECPVAKVLNFKMSVQTILAIYSTFIANFCSNVFILCIFSKNIFILKVDISTC